MALQSNNWSCTLSADPDQVRKHDEVTLTATLSNTEFDGLNEKDQETVYAKGFTYKYETGNLLLQNAINNAPENNTRQFSFEVPDLSGGDYAITITVTATAPTDWQDDPLEDLTRPTDAITQKATISVTQVFETESNVTLNRTFAGPTDDRALWTAIRNRTAAIGFERYKKFIDCVFCRVPIDINMFFPTQSEAVGTLNIGNRNLRSIDQCLDPRDPTDRTDKRQLSIYGPYAYSILKLATQVFLTLESGVVIRDPPGRPKIFDLKKERIRLNDFSLELSDLKRDLANYLGSEHLPYLDRILANLITLDDGNVKEVLPYCFGVLQHRLTSPSLIELIWSYWLEEGMLVQTMNAIARRFQNRRGSPNDPLGELEFDPLRPLNNLIWGFIQDEHNRLTVPRRTHEYLHHYGLSLVGKAVPDLNPADSRSKFIEAFHNLLSAAARFFKEDSDTTVIADAFPLLNALKEVHLILAEGAHNQFGDLTWTARAEMMTIQWMLARPEMREFLRGRYMVPYQEEWMGAVDSMKKLQGWTDTTITHFYELAVTGERILLSVRYGDWSDIENIEDQAKNWARSNKPEIQRYIHGYRTVTGVDLAADIIDSRDAAARYLQPSVLLQRRLREQISVASRSANGPDLIAARVSSTAALPGPGRSRLPVYRKET
jgi:hypothetical protein